jgi:NaMN:DMB phosphoribosyltransferase
MAPGGADYSKHSTDELKAMLRPGVMGRNELKFKTLIRRELKKREQQGVAALAKAGREGKDLDKIRDKYNKYDESRQVSEMATGGGSSSAGVATSMGGPAHKPTSGVPKKLGNAAKMKKVAVGKGVY